MSKRIKLPVEVASIQGDGFHIFIKARIEKTNLRLLIDTGASKTVLDKSFLEKHFKDLPMNTSQQLTTGLGANNIESHFTEIRNLKIGGVKIKYYTTHILDLSQVNGTYTQIGMPEINGVIGCDLLLQLKATINFRKKMLTISQC